MSHYVYYTVPTHITEKYFPCHKWLKNHISEYARYSVFLHWLHSLRCFTSLLLNGNLWLRPLRCFSSLITLTTLFYFTTTNPRDGTTLTTLLLSLIDQIVFPQEFQCLHKICMCHSSFTVGKFSGVLHALLPSFNSQSCFHSESEKN